MRDDVAGFYDAIADAFHLVHRDWDDSVRRQGEALDRLLAAELGPGPKRVLDCACGIGTQAIGLALRGHRVTGTDLSARELERASREAAARGVELAVSVADLRELTAPVEGPFDAVLACDNAVAHLAPEKLGDAFASMRSVCRPRGLVLASVRDYAALVRDRPRLVSPQAAEDEQGRAVTLQLWDWAADGASYRATMLFLRERDGRWETAAHETTLYAHLGEPLLAAARAAGLEGVRWLEPGASGYFQPLVAGRA